MDAAVHSVGDTKPSETLDDGDAGTSPNPSPRLAAVGEPCLADSECDSDFCDRDTCAALESRSGYGQECAPPPIGPLGRPISKYKFCSYPCIDGRCRSCSSDAECRDLEGREACVQVDGLPGRTCSEGPDSASDMSSEEFPELEQGTAASLEEEPSCPVQQLSIELSAHEESWTNPRLALVWWHQRIGEHDEFISVAYDAAIVSDEPSVVTLADVRAPAHENLVCERACTDRSRCPCLGAPAVAIASILVAQDVDRDLELSVDEIVSEQVAGTDQAVVGWSGTSSDSQALVWSGFFGSVHSGACAYRTSDNEAPYLEPVEQRTFPLQLSTCPASTPACAFDVPAGFCLADCAPSGLNRYGF